jgi:predicted RNase H-like HicB family nuclease
VATLETNRYNSTVIGCAGFSSEEVFVRRPFTLEYWVDDGWFIGRLREVPGVFSQGETLEELEANIQDAYELMRETDDAPVPAGSQLKQVELEV